MNGEEPQAAAGDSLTALERHYQRKAEFQTQDFRGDALNHLLFRHVAGSCLLDVGAGSGAATIFFSKRGMDIHGIDVSEPMLTLAKRTLAAHGLDPALVSSQPLESFPEGQFSTVLCCDVIEHVEDDLALLRAIRRVLRPNGRLLLTVPAIAWLYGPKDRAIGHFRRYERRTLRAVLTAAGFKVTRMRSWNLVGVLPTIFAVKVRRKAVDESFRYGTGWPHTWLRSFLKLWFVHFENRVSLGCGLTLLAVAEPEP